MTYISLDGSGDQALNIPELTSLLDISDVEVISQTSNSLTARAVANGINFTFDYEGTNFGTSSALVNKMSGRSDDNSYIVKVEDVSLTEADLSASAAEIEASILSGNDLVLGSLDGGSLWARLGTGNDNVALFSGTQNLINTNQGSDWLEAFGGSGELRGGRDNDLFELHDDASFLSNGNKGNDTLINYGGNSTLRGGQGNDRLVSNGGRSTMYGDLGSDTFVFFENGFGEVMDFQNGIDQLDFSNLANVTFDVVNGGTQVSNNNTIVGFIENYFV